MKTQNEKDTARGKEIQDIIAEILKSAHIQHSEIEAMSIEFKSEINRYYPRNTFYATVTVEENSLTYDAVDKIATALKTKDLFFSNCKGPSFDDCYIVSCTHSMIEIYNIPQ